MTTATQPAPYSTLEGALASGFATNQLHYAPGHDLGTPHEQKNDPPQVAGQSRSWECQAAKIDLMSACHSFKVLVVPKAAKTRPLEQARRLYKRHIVDRRRGPLWQRCRKQVVSTGRAPPIRSHQHPINGLALLNAHHPQPLRFDNFKAAGAVQPDDPRCTQL